MPSFVFIRPTVWPRTYNTPALHTDRSRLHWTDNGPIAEIVPFYKRSPKNPFIIFSFVTLNLNLIAYTFVIKLGSLLDFISSTRPIVINYRKSLPWKQPKLAATMVTFYIVTRNVGQCQT